MFLFRCVREINDLFAGWMLVELLCNALVISLRLYVVINVCMYIYKYNIYIIIAHTIKLSFFQLLKNADPRAFGEMVFLGTTFSDPFVVCYSGQIITDMVRICFN